MPTLYPNYLHRQSYPNFAFDKPIKQIESKCMVVCDDINFLKNNNIFEQLESIPDCKCSARTGFFLE